ncbi:hypothetical protein V1478_006419 [Vespula squamosa]|uniref:Uncharacterized protein n=1 Tax=Vespula squamosa TaxID=30214 RepID=A0ABD2B7S4_VESSQ
MKKEKKKERRRAMKVVCRQGERCEEKSCEMNRIIGLNPLVQSSVRVYKLMAKRIEKSGYDVRFVCVEDTHVSRMWLSSFCLSLSGKLINVLITASLKRWLPLYRQSSIYRPFYSNGRTIGNDHLHLPSGLAV